MIVVAMMMIMIMVMIEMVQLMMTMTITAIRAVMTIVEAGIMEMRIVKQYS